MRRDRDGFPGLVLRTNSDQHRFQGCHLLVNGIHRHRHTPHIGRQLAHVFGHALHIARHDRHVGIHADGKVVHVLSEAVDQVKALRSQDDKGEQGRMDNDFPTSSTGLECRRQPLQTCVFVGGRLSRLIGVFR